MGTRTMTTFSNMPIAELERQAYREDNTLALALHDKMLDDLETLEAKHSDQLEEIACLFTDKLDSAIKSHVDSHYLDVTSDDFDFNYMLWESVWSIEDCISRLRDELTSSSDPTGITATTEQFLLSLDSGGISDLDLAIAEDVSTTCDLVKSHGLSGTSLFDLWGFSLGEIEEESEHWLKDIPECLHEMVKAESDYCFSDGCFYVDLTYDIINWSVNLEWLEQYASDQLAGHYA